MTLYTYINENIDRIRVEIKAGIIPCSLLRHWEIYSRYHAYLKTGANITTAAIWTGSDFRVSDRWVKYVIKNMEKAINESPNYQLQPAKPSADHGGMDRGA